MILGDDYVLVYVTTKGPEKYVFIRRRIIVATTAFLTSVQRSRSYHVHNKL